MLDRYQDLPHVQTYEFPVWEGDVDRVHVPRNVYDEMKEHYIMARASVSHPGNAFSLLGVPVDVVPEEVGVPYVSVKEDKESPLYEELESVLGSAFVKFLEADRTAFDRLDLPDVYYADEWNGPTHNYF